METAAKNYPVNEKIRQVILESDMNASQFAEAIGVQRSTISHILSHRNKPGNEILQKINRWNPKYTLDWLMENAHESEFKPTKETVNQEFSHYKRAPQSTSESNRKNSMNRSPALFNSRGLENTQKSMGTEPEQLQTPITKPRSPVQINILYDDGSYEVIPVGRK